MELEIGVTNSDTSLESWFSSDASTGYLEDAIAGWGIWCNQQSSPSDSDQYQSLSCLQNTHYLGDQVDVLAACSSTKTQFLDDYCFADCPKFNTISQPFSPNDVHGNDASPPKGKWTKIAYPFELVKPGGVKGETTLKDINHQMLMSPAKPIPHPVADSVAHPCRPARVFGMSGKAVVALTRIHTQGRGSITIMRTKG